MSDEKISTARLIKTYMRIRTAKQAASREHDAADAEFKASLKMIEVELLRRAQDQDVSGFKIKGVATAFQQEEMHVSIGDDKVFYQHCRDTGDLDFFERRITIKHVKEYMGANGGELPPGVYAFRENRMQIRVANDRPKGRRNDGPSDEPAEPDADSARDD